MANLTPNTPTLQDLIYNYYLNGGGAGSFYNSTPPTYTNGQAASLQTDQNGNLKDTLATRLAGEDLTNDVLKTELRYAYYVVSTAATTTIKGGPGFIHAVNIVGGTAGAVTIYDNTAGSGAIILPTFTPTATYPAPTTILDTTFATGLTVVTAAATLIEVSYR